MRAEQRKQRHSDGTAFHHAKQGCIKAEPGLQHDGYTVARLDTFGPEGSALFVMNALTGLRRSQFPRARRRARPVRLPHERCDGRRTHARC